MLNILVDDANPKTLNILIKYLYIAGFDVISAEDGLVFVQLPPESKTQGSIFPSVPRLSKVFEFIELNYHQKIGLKEVAQAVGHSPAYLTDLVRRLTGKAVNKWIIERRLVEASTLLLETNSSVEDISVKVGYKNTNHFYRQFRNYYKYTPRSWRGIQHCKVA